MYWSRKFKLFDCNTTNPCSYTGIPKNNQRFSNIYKLADCSDG